MARKSSGWGNYPVVKSEVLGFSSETELRERLGTDGVIAQGLLRSYGDSALSEHAITTLRFNRFLSFDPGTGLLACEAGVSLSDISFSFVALTYDVLKMRWGFIDTSGRMVIEPVYQSTFGFSEGLAFVMITSPEDE